MDFIHRIITLLINGLLIQSALWVTPFSIAAPTPKVGLAFFYGSPLPLAEMTFYPGVVVQPDKINAQELNWLKHRNIKVYAYLSVGESDQASDKGLISNAEWRSQVMDLTTDSWQNRLLTQAKTLRKTGFDGLFLDTLDSYQLLPESAQPAQKKALLTLIQRLSALFNHQLALNRGFEMLSALQGKAQYVIAEGLFSRYSPRNDSYGLTSQTEQHWLTQRLKQAKQLGFKVQVIDYAPSPKRAGMAQKIHRAGYLAWVTDGHLLTWGTSQIIPVPRRILVPYNGKLRALIDTDAHQRLATLIEYLGYIPDYIDLSKKTLPIADPALYAGIIVWTNNPKLYSTSLNHWLIQNKGKIPQLAMGILPPTPELLANFGVKLMEELPAGPYSSPQMPAWLKGEVPGSLEGFTPYPLTLLDTGTSLLSVSTPQQQTLVQASHSDNGTLMTDPWIISLTPDGDSDWIIDPVQLLSRGLGLKPIPAPDVTTESGRRRLILYIDGDAFPSLALMPGQPFAAQVIDKEIIQHYQLPITVSIIQGEIAPNGLYTKLSKRLEKIARKIFARPYVDIASHSFSHPFFWGNLAGRTHIPKSKADYGYHLEIPGYDKIDLKREIDGSINYINQKLAPKNKQVKIMLWSGDAAPGPKALQRAANMNVLNVNGGNTLVLKDNPTLSSIWPIGRKEGELLYQIYAPILNENVFTNEWHGPYDGFRRLVETFQLTEKPYRLKPFTIYFHFFSGTNPAGVNALHTVIQTALSQPNTPIQLSRYARSARDFYFSALGRDIQGNWLFNSQRISTLRLPPALGFADINTSKGLAGMTANGRYLHLPDGQARFSLQKKQPVTHKPYLLSANVTLKQWSDGHIRFYAWKPAQLVLANAAHCVLISRQGHRYSGQTAEKPTHLEPGQTIFNLPQGDFVGQLSCKNKL
jgi:hypothetical protein